MNSPKPNLICTENGKVKERLKYFHVNYLHLIRYPNLFIIALVQIFIKYGLFHPFGAYTALNSFSFSWLIVATLCIAAAGNIINDIYDIEIDEVNKRRVLIGNEISEKSAFRMFMVLNIIGIAIGFYLANTIGKPGFAAFFIVISVLLFLYASYLKSILLIGNLLISLLVAMSILVVPIFDLLPAITFENQSLQTAIFKIVFYYALFAFGITFIREIVKDLQDINGDKKGGITTLPIVLGRKRTTFTVFFLGVAAVLAVVYFMYQHLYNKQIIMLYFLFAVVAPLLYYCVKAWDAITTADYARLSKILKIVMILGICSIPLYQFTLN